jgi:hypothetical protein
VTEEENAIHNVLLSLFCWVDTREDRPAESRIFINARETIDCCTNIAVKAETERCATVAESCGMPCTDHVIEQKLMSQEIAAAIRALPTPEPGDADDYGDRVSPYDPAGQKRKRERGKRA